VAFVVKTYLLKGLKDISMSIQPQGEELRKAVTWISEERQYNPGKTISTLVEKACLKFDLSPKDADFLLRTLLDEGK